MTHPSMSPHEFMRSAPAPLNSNTPWGSRYAAELRRVIHRHAAGAERSLQRHLGPSEVGSVCDRQVAGKLAGLPRTNHVTDPWPSILGTAGHAWLEEAFRAENERLGRGRWVPEQKVEPFDGLTPFQTHRGTADLYDADEQSVGDWKILGPTSMAKVRSPDGPPQNYVVQLLLYKRGYENLGLPVRRVALVALPRTAPSLDGMYVWERPSSPADDELIEQVRQRLVYRKKWAAALVTGVATLRDVPFDTTDSCQWCPFYRPQSAHDNGTGCPGHATGRT